MSALRALLVLVLVSGLLVPRVGAAFVAVAPGVRTVVICTGDALVTITLDASGAPVELDRGEPAPCIAAAPPPEDEAPSEWRRLAMAIPGPVRAVSAPLGPDPALLPYRKRGPPPPV